VLHTARRQVALRIGSVRVRVPRADVGGFIDWEDVRPGKAVILTRSGVSRRQVIPATTFAPDIFAYVYLARPDSVLDRISVYRSQMAMGDAGGAARAHRKVNHGQRRDPRARHLAGRRAEPSRQLEWVAIPGNWRRRNDVAVPVRASYVFSLISIGRRLCSPIKEDPRFSPGTLRALEAPEDDWVVNRFFFHIQLFE